MKRLLLILALVALVSVQPVSAQPSTELPQEIVLNMGGVGVGTWYCRREEDDPSLANVTIDTLDGRLASYGCSFIKQAAD
jgi:hypothetical protein